MAKLTKEQKQKWCEQQELIDWEIMVNNFSGYGVTQFQMIEQLPRYSEIDYQASALTETKELKAVYAIEFKNRFGYDANSPIIRKEGIFIEPDKYASLLDEWRFEGKIPLYICAWKDGYISVHNLTKLSHKPKYDPRRNIKKSYDGDKTYEGRFYLDIGDAVWLKMK